MRNERQDETDRAADALMRSCSLNPAFGGYLNRVKIGLGMHAIGVGFGREGSNAVQRQEYFKYSQSRSDKHP